MVFSSGTVVDPSPTVPYAKRWRRPSSTTPTTIPGYVDGTRVPTIASTFALSAGFGDSTTSLGDPTASAPCEASVGAVPTSEPLEAAGPGRVPAPASRPAS